MPLTRTSPVLGHAGDVFPFSDNLMQNSPQPALTMDAPEKNSRSLTATYTSPANEPFTVAETIPAPLSASVADKTQYLQALRQAVDDTQARINRELTARMQEDKSRDATASKQGAAKPDVDEDKEEENYGEEIPDQD